MMRSELHVMNELCLEATYAMLTHGEQKLEATSESSVMSERGLGGLSKLRLFALAPKPAGLAPNGACKGRSSDLLLM